MGTIKDADRPRKIIKHRDQTWSENGVSDVDSSTFPYQRDETHQFFADRLNTLPKSHVLEIGCGEGKVAVHLAKRGARVTAVDVSSEAVDTTRKSAVHNEVEDRIVVKQRDALELETLSNTFDFVVGRFILHHIEPFSEFVDVLDSITTPDARGHFLENSARNPLLMFFRKHMTGRFGFPNTGMTTSTRLPGGRSRYYATTLTQPSTTPNWSFSKR